MSRYNFLQDKCVDVSPVNYIPSSAWGEEEVPNDDLEKEKSVEHTQWRTTAGKNKQVNRQNFRDNYLKIALDNKNVNK
ncbi:hypothetical protein RUM43_006522 [Polyplax serrata]|uniref:Uncharacterized protein n=1 Tax=Polyplax serrata TaxID=468196 RepID=A0AAN8S3S0_POLSC